MTETIQVAIISASLAALINCIFQILNRLIDLKKASADKAEEEARLYKEKKGTGLYSSFRSTSSNQAGI